MNRALVFVLVSALLGWVSWRSLANPRVHGFYRFFAWEAILILTLMNVDSWFVESFSLRQCISWLLLLSSVGLVVLGVLQLHHGGQSAERAPGDPRFRFERTTALVTTGIYRYIRHPLYSSLLFLTWAVLLKNPSPAALVMAGVASVFLFVTAVVEESECVASFGEAYRAYMGRTKRFIPFLI